MASAAHKDLMAVVPNPFREGRLGRIPWQRDWRPCAEWTCPKCRVVVAVRPVADQRCGRMRDGERCKEPVVPHWEHPGWTGSLPLWEVWRGIVQKLWNVDIAANTSEVKRLASEPVVVVERKRVARIALEDEQDGAPEDEADDENTRAIGAAPGAHKPLACELTAQTTAEARAGSPRRIPRRNGGAAAAGDGRVRAGATARRSTTG